MVEQARSRHYSPFSLYDLDAFEEALAAFRKKVDAAGITQILRETPRIKVYDHDHAYGFHLGKMEYAVFADWDSGRLCRDVSLEEGARQPRITDFDHDDALNEMVDCLVRMLATIEAGGASPKPAELAEGISTALFTTLVGLAIAIPAIAAYNVIRNRVSRLLLEVGVTSENLMSRFEDVQPQGAKK